ncbi:Glycosyltransferase involved in cell wall bisynthesis [Paracoccus isoporae]|uniref:Glycosyltransferase involved in cell wall bisynthesis n=1 Tax=Paracoccus isoporae TaxID=591205 RepID=A0A1G7BUC7_9RHOB|nr:Glycosyltransferase involved in cell wall bisynthesis [Paracoccus isoporae]
MLKVILKSGELDEVRARRCLSYARETADIETALAAMKHLAGKLRAANSMSPAIERELVSLEGDELYGLARLDELPAIAIDPVVPTPGRLLYLLHHSRPYLTNGYATRGHGVATGLREAGVDLVCLTRPGFPLDVVKDLPAFIPESDLIDGITYLRQLHPKRSGRGRSQMYFADAADQIERRLREIRPQAVMVASNYVAAIPAVMAAHRCGLPIAYEVRGFWEVTQLSRDSGLEKTMKFRAQKALESRVAAACDHVFTLASPMRDELVRRGVARDKISLLPNSCDTAQFCPQPRADALAEKWSIPQGVPVIGYIGSFVQYEGLDDLTRACARLRREGHVFRLVLVGGNTNGTVEAEIAEIARESGLGDWLITPGRVPHEQVDAWYSLIDIAPFPRKPQPVTELVSPLKPLEAMAAGKAVVMSSVRAMAEMVEGGQTGLVFQKGNADDLATKLAKLIEDRDIRRSLGQNARRYILAERTWRSMGERVKHWMQQL